MQTNNTQSYKSLIAMSSTDEMLNALLKSVAELQEAHTASCQDLEAKFSRLEEDVKSSQLEAIEKAVKKAKREWPLEFKKRGHEEQYYFNQDISDCIVSATQQLGKMNPSSYRDKATLEKTIKELEEGVALIAQHQKFIRIANQSEHHWQTVAAYKGNDLAEDEEDAKRLEKAERTAEQQAAKKHRKAATTRVITKQGSDNGQAPSNSQKLALFPRPQFSGSHFTPRTPGPCFNCSEMGHLKANCPKLAGTYPFDSSVDLCVTSTVCMCDSVCVCKTNKILSDPSEALVVPSSRICTGVEVADISADWLQSEQLVPDKPDNSSSSLTEAVPASSPPDSGTETIGDLSNQPWLHRRRPCPGKVLGVRDGRSSGYYCPR